MENHAGAATCTLKLALDQTAGPYLDVIDDGKGIGTNRGTGVGLSSMRERAAELGGTLTVTARIAGRHGRHRGAALPDLDAFTAGRNSHGGHSGADRRRPPAIPCGLRALLASATDLELAGEAGNGEQAIRLATELQPDVIVMDLQMPGVGGIEATRRILHSSPHISVLVLSMFEDDDSIFAALQAGARGYLLKER